MTQATLQGSRFFGWFSSGKIYLALAFILISVGVIMYLGDNSSGDLKTSVLSESASNPFNGSGSGTASDSTLSVNSTTQNNSFSSEENNEEEELSFEENLEEENTDEEIEATLSEDSDVTSGVTPPEEVVHPAASTSTESAPIVTSPVSSVTTSVTNSSVKDNTPYHKTFLEEIPAPVTNHADFTATKPDNNSKSGPEIWLLLGLSFLGSGLYRKFKKVN